MKVKDIMSKKVVKVSPKDTFTRVSLLIFSKSFKRKFSSVPVVDEKGKLVGLVTEKDILVKLYPTQTELIEDFFSASKISIIEEKIKEIAQTPIEKIMTKNPLVIDPEMPIFKAGALMLAERVRRMPVVDKKGKLVGIISQGDIFRAIFKKFFPKKEKIKK